MNKDPIQRADENLDRWCNFIEDLLEGLGADESTVGYETVREFALAVIQDWRRQAELDQAVKDHEIHGVTDCPALAEPRERASLTRQRVRNALAAMEVSPDHESNELLRHHAYRWYRATLKYNRLVRLSGAPNMKPGSVRVVGRGLSVEVAA